MSSKNRVHQRANGTAARPEYPMDDAGGGLERGENSSMRGGATSQGEPAADPTGSCLQGCAQMFARYPVTTLVASFGMGLGLGVLVTALMAREQRVSWMARHHLPDSWDGLARGLRLVPFQVSQYLPDSLSRRM